MMHIQDISLTICLSFITASLNITTLIKESILMYQFEDKSDLSTVLRVRLVRLKFLSHLTATLWIYMLL